MVLPNRPETKAAGSGAPKPQVAAGVARPEAKAGMGDKPKTRPIIHIAGFGDAAKAVALFHLRAGYKVRMYVEKNPKGASGLWVRQHNGFEYPDPEDPQTSYDCLHASAVMDKVLPQAIYNLLSGVEYYITDQSEKDGKPHGESKEPKVKIRTVATQKRHAELLVAEYEKAYGEKPPKEFCQFIGKKEAQARSERFVGGIRTNERSINPVVAGQVIDDKLHEYIENGQLEICERRKLINIKRLSVGKFEAEFDHGNGTTSTEIIEGRFINCTGINVLDLACKLEGAEKVAEKIASVTIVHRGMAIADISKLPSANKGNTVFPMASVTEVEKICGMLSCLNTKLAYVYGLTASYLQISKDGKINFVLTPQSPAVPAEAIFGISEDEKRKRIQAIQVLAQSTYAEMLGGHDIPIVELVTAPLCIVTKKERGREQKESGKDKEGKEIPAVADLTKRSRKGELVFNVGGDAGHHFMEKGTYFVIDGIESLRETLRYEVINRSLRMDQANEIFRNIYDGNITELGPISPLKVKDEAWFTTPEKAELLEKLKDPEYHKILLQRAKRVFGDKAGPLMVSHLPGIDRLEEKGKVDIASPLPPGLTRRGSMGAAMARHSNNSPEIGHEFASTPPPTVVVHVRAGDGSPPDPGSEPPHGRLLLPAATPNPTPVPPLRSFARPKSAGSLVGESWEVKVKEEKGKASAQGAGPAAGAAAAGSSATCSAMVSTSAMEAKGGDESRPNSTTPQGFASRLSGSLPTSGSAPSSAGVLSNSGGSAPASATDRGSHSRSASSDRADGVSQTLLALAAGNRYEGRPVTR